MKRVCFLVDSWFFGEHSGIYTFIKHYASMIEKLDGVVLDILCDYDAPDKFRKDPVFKSVAFNGDLVTKRAKQGFASDAIESYEIKLNKYLSEPSVAKNTIAVVAHSFTATMAMVKYKEDFKDITFMAYTHIGDILDPTLATLYDFEEKYVVEHLEVLKKNPDIAIGTQNKGVVKRLEELLERNNIHCLPEPFFYGKFKTGNPDGPVLILSSNYKRKKMELMIKTAAAMNKDVLIVAGDWEEESCKRIDDLILEYGIKKAIILRGIPNRHIRRHIEKCSVMLHFSKLEVMPYAVMEAMLSVPVIMDIDALWSEAFPFDSPARVKVEEIDVVKETIASIDRDAVIEHGRVEVEGYATEAIKVWSKYLGLPVKGE